MPVLEYNLKYQTEDVTKILKMMQGINFNSHNIINMRNAITALT